MRKLFMAVAILGISATVSFAKAQCVNENGNKEPFAVEFGKLSSYLDLTPSQMDEVYDINEYFKGHLEDFDKDKFLDFFPMLDLLWYYWAEMMYQKVHNPIYQTIAKNNLKRLKTYKL